ncbi:persulfide dioxygenase ETHE1 homolog, mitochondrial [Coccinella septempunctata]|uniref:persulfide dioxygenase ETHE1 homolog, mitochondrial n=1 Tax=Coccinella septempunctata TaxID=41139 RepID=UPI001D067D4A|nr:persulfide dioxygenase ETHE1 homolog, mitochondrial [Coccinella septempunctata]
MALKTCVNSKNHFIFRQLFDSLSCTYTYLLGDLNKKECILIDPVLEQVKRDFSLVNELGLKLCLALNTHMHADHITGTGYLKKLTGCKSAISKASGAQADIYLEDEEQISLGNICLKVLSTPGHTNGCVSYYCKDQHIVFTGDALLIRGCGRTDFQEGDPAILYKSIYSRLFTLPPETVVYPAHDYRGMMSSTISEEMKYNPRLTKSLEKFVDIMNNLNLGYPKQIDKALPANRSCGLHYIPKENLQNTVL